MARSQKSEIGVGNHLLKRSIPIFSSRP